LKGSQLLSQVVQRVKQVQDPNQRLQIFERVRPELQKFGVELPQNLTLESVTDQGLIPLETGLGQTIQQLTTGQRDLESRAQALVGSINPETKQPFTLEQARQSIVARESGIVPRAGTETFRERVKDPEEVKRIAGLESQLAESKARGAGAGRVSTKAIEGAFESVGNLESNNANLRRALSALERGGKTGAFQRFLPSLTEASRELNQIQSQLGLDVVGSVTFGALSEGELNLALSTALDLGQSEEALSRQIQEKITAQEKLTDYLDEQIEFLEGGGTVGEWRAFIRGRGQKQGTTQQAPAQGSQEGEVMVDANGNRALVFPDGTFREL
jgi:hypothetical protein